MAVRIERPPNFDAIVAKFPAAAGDRILFAYGPDIFNPSGIAMQSYIQAHEERHCARQMVVGADEWWTKYIADDAFRYSEELLGHVAEYQDQIRRVKDRNKRAKILQSTALRLIAPLYQYAPGIAALPTAMRDIRWLSEK